MDDIENVLRVTWAVAFSAIMDDPRDWVSADTWVVHFQNYSPGHSGITIGDSHFSSVDLVKFLRPYSAYEPLVPFCGNEFLSGLGEMVDNKGEEIQRIFTPLEWFCRAWTRNEMVSERIFLQNLLFHAPIKENFQVDQSQVIGVRPDFLSHVLIYGIRKVFFVFEGVWKPSEEKRHDSLVVIYGALPEPLCLFH